MDSASTKLIIEILGLAARYGIPAVKAIIETWEKTTITSEDVAALKTAVRHPDEYGREN